jgi:hypothetical protein
MKQLGSAGMRLAITLAAAMTAIVLHPPLPPLPWHWQVPSATATQPAQKEYRKGHLFAL